MTLTEYDQMAAQQERVIADLNVYVPDWEYREDEAMGRYLSEWDFPVEDGSADESLISDDDWNAFIEMSWVDPAERV